MSRPTYQVESFSLVWPEAQHLLRLHWDEIAREKETIELAPMYEQYLNLEKTGQLLLVTMRMPFDFKNVSEDEGKLVGYHASFVRPHLHYGKSLTAFTDLFFIHPAHRLGRNAWRLFRAVEAECYARGVQRMFASCKLEHDLLPLFSALGWTEIERNFSKVI